MLTWGNDKWRLFFIKWPVVIFTAITAPAAVVQIFVFTDQIGETENSLRSIVVDAKVEVGSTAIWLATIHADTGKFSL